MQKLQIQKSYIPLIRKTKDEFQWMAYVKSKLKESRGYEKHKNN